MFSQFFCPVRTGEVVFMSSVVTRRRIPSRLIDMIARGITHAPHSFSSSMEVKVSAYRQSLTDPVMSSLACQALLTMVAGKRFHVLYCQLSSFAGGFRFHTLSPTVSPFGAKLPVPALAPSTSQQLRDYDAAGLRRANRLKAREQQPFIKTNSQEPSEAAYSEALSAAADAAAAGRALVACSSTHVTQVQPASLYNLAPPHNWKQKSAAFRDLTPTQVETVLPSHTNMHGSAFGGTVMSWIDSCASLAASRGGRCAVVAAGFDEIAFVAPLRLGEHAVIDSKVTRSWGTSLEV